MCACVRGSRAGAGLRTLVRGEREGTSDALPSLLGEEVPGRWGPGSGPACVPRPQGMCSSSDGYRHSPRLPPGWNRAGLLVTRGLCLMEPESSWRGPNALPMSLGTWLGRASDPGLLGKVDEKRTSQTSHAKGRLCPCGCRERKGSGQSWRVGRVGASCSGGDEDEAGRRPGRRPRPGNPP